MSFDPNTFLNQEYEGVLDTKVIPCPAGEFPAISEKVDVVPWASRDGSKSGLKAQIIWDIQDDNVKAVCQRDTVKVRQDIMLDLTEDGNSLDMGKGKNIGLGRLREALGMNQPGQSFSFPAMQGRLATVKVSHRAGDNPEDIFAEVKAVTAAA